MIYLGRPLTSFENVNDSASDVDNLFTNNTSAEKSVKVVSS